MRIYVCAKQSDPTHKEPFENSTKFNITKRQKWSSRRNQKNTYWKRF